MRDPRGGDVTGAGLYIHVPFCASVCPYCDFAVLLAGEERRLAYLRGVSREASMYADLGLRFDTVYLGGGTPSSLRPDQLAGILESVGRHLDIDTDAWVFLEVNPEDVSPRAVAVWRELGIDTVSLGMQSFDDEALRFLGRRHDAACARRALDELRSAGFHTVSIDLIYGHEGQTPASWRHQLEEAVSRSVEHISCYQLTFHEGTVFGRRLQQSRMFELSGDRQADLFLLTHASLADAGYEGYEVSSFALGAEHRSRHNIKYWSHVPYLGLGPSAHSFDGGRRWWNRRKLRLWQRDLEVDVPPVDGDEQLSQNQLALEAVIFGLRSVDGIDLAAFERRFGFDLLSANRRVVESFETSGHLRVDGSSLRPTTAGMAIADAIAKSLDVPTSQRRWPYT
jgi:oxygen-independent coproporphyrinogen-3 oxidase